MSTTTGERVRLERAPIGLRDANAWVDRIHRHHGPTRGHKFSTSVIDDQGAVRGVGIAGRPVSRHLQAQGYIEVTRVATDGTPNACSMLYGGLRAAAITLGYKPWQVVTYTLASETGASLRAAGWVLDSTSAGGSWDRADRPRADEHPLEPKLRWIAGPRPTL
ncbi:hypothetical protein QT381_02610 [Galbitalea sp. SE-J8]|uniref:XF1762 family protein n=1 Tax=Galbitalea sp. SE-J8 TaxID=3054952 RepID=UPI00259D0D69|nr:XF1762 family protein [Galbitalea sp. SE-J8]MDM4761895.1 hypothetical protein [Galbitalea sp. SE-J8]